MGGCGKRGGSGNRGWLNKSGTLGVVPLRGNFGLDLWGAGAFAEDAEESFSIGGIEKHTIIVEIDGIAKTG